MLRASVFHRMPFTFSKIGQGLAWAGGHFIKSPSLLKFLGMVSTTVVVNACTDGRAQTPVPTTDVRDALTELARGEGDLAPLTVTFDHLHALHGGLQLTIHGDGRVEQRALRTKAGDPKDQITQDDLKSLAALLVKHEVWTERIDERPPVPDESRATLKTCYRDECVEIREWYNDLEKNARIGDVLKVMKTVAWKPPTPEKWKVTITTRGGFTGKGTGGMIATSDGYVTTDRLGRPACRQQLAPADLGSLTLIVAEAKPASWTPSYVRTSNPHGCCDQFRYSLTLEVQHAEGTPTKYRTFWYSEMSNTLPADVRGLFDAAWKMKKEADTKCNSR